MSTFQTCSITQAAALLNSGEVIAYPTEAVWGLGCDPFNEQAVQELLRIKHRPVDKGLILVADNWSQLSAYIDHEVLVQIQQQAVSERATTWLLPYLPGTLPNWVTGQHQTVAVRVSQHPTIKALTKKFNAPIISTSANPSGCLAAREIFQIRRYFGLRLAICRGRIRGDDRPSQIINGLTGKLLRD